MPTHDTQALVGALSPAELLLLADAPVAFVEAGIAAAVEIAELLQADPQLGWSALEADAVQLETTFRKLGVYGAWRIMIATQDCPSTFPSAHDIALIERAGRPVGPGEYGRHYWDTYI